MSGPVALDSYRLASGEIQEASGLRTRAYCCIELKFRTSFTSRTSTYVLLVMEVITLSERKIIIEVIDEVSLDGLAETSGSRWQGKEVSKRGRHKPSFILYPYHINNYYSVDAIGMRACFHHLLHKR
jgi:hypothetical protein